MAERDIPSRRLALVRDLARLAPDPLDELGLAFEPIEPARHLDTWRAFARAADEGRVPPGLVLYAHLPFCARVCSYCLLAARKAPPRRDIQAYVRALVVDAERHAAVLGGHPVQALHLGGGTPTLLSLEELDLLLRTLTSVFQRAPGFRIGVEGHPTTTTRDKTELFARHGVRRLSLGVESFTRGVLERVDRGDQTPERVVRAVEACRSAGLGVNLDLLAGLPGETLESFEQSVRQALALAPDSLSVNRWVAEKSVLAARGALPTLQDHRLVDEMLALADRVIRRERPPTDPPESTQSPGFGTQYDWDPSPGGYFQQDMIGPTSILALGHGGLGHVYAGYFYTAAGSVDQWVGALERGEPAGVLAAPVSRRFELAFALTERACRGVFDPSVALKELGVDVRSVFGEAIDFLTEQGLLSTDGAWRKAPSREFEAAHMLMFLLLDEDELERRVRRLSDQSRPLPAVLRQYREVDAETPASVLWCRIAMRADQSARQLAADEAGAT